MANHVFLMEPQWKPMLEDQALDRVYRIGQTKEVTTTRYIVANTLEEVCWILLTLVDITLLTFLRASAISD